MSSWCLGWGLPGGGSGDRPAGLDAVPGGFHGDDLGLLKTLAREMGTQLDRIRQRIEEIEKEETEKGEGV
jgi:hypothetical protein